MPTPFLLEVSIHLASHGLFTDSGSGDSFAITAVQRCLGCMRLDLGRAKLLSISGQFKESIPFRSSA